LRLGAVDAAIDRVVLLNAMADDPHAAMLTAWRYDLDGALKAVEHPDLAVSMHLERLVVVVAA